MGVEIVCNGNRQVTNLSLDARQAEDDSASAHGKRSNSKGPQPQPGPALQKALDLFKRIGCIHSKKTKYIHALLVLLTWDLICSRWSPGCPRHHDDELFQLIKQEKQMPSHDAKLPRGFLNEFRKIEPRLLAIRDTTNKATRDLAAILDIDASELQGKEYPIDLGLVDTAIMAHLCLLAGIYHPFHRWRGPVIEARQAA